MSRHFAEIGAAMKSHRYVFLPVVLMSTMLPTRAYTAKVTSFEGIDIQQPPQGAIDENGAVGTKQYAEVVNPYLQAWDKATHAPVWSAYQDIASILKDCKNAGDVVILFDHLAQNATGTTGAWVIGAHNSPGSAGPYYYCVAVSNTDDLDNPQLAWFTYEFALDSYLGTDQEGNPNFPDWPKIGTWWNAYYVTIDVLDPDDLGSNVGAYMPLGVIVCALDRADMLLNNPAKYQCLTDPSPIPQNPTSADLYLRHSLIPADLDGNTAPPANRDEFLLSIQNPPNDLKTTTSNTINLWDFHLGADFENSTLTRTSVTVPTYTPGCYDSPHPLNTICVPQPSTGKSGSGSV